MNFEFTILLEAMAALLLVSAAIIDVRTFRIPNRLNLVLAALAPAYWWSSGITSWPGSAIQIGIALLVLGGFAVMFFLRLMGGGDVKLAAALTLWLAPAETLRFLVFMSLAGGLLTAALLVAQKARSRTGRPTIPYGVAIAAGGLAIFAQRFLNQFA